MRTYAQQKAGLTRAKKAGRDALIAECRKVKAEWNASSWPDDWAAWQRALDDVCAWPSLLLDDV